MVKIIAAADINNLDIAIMDLSQKINITNIQKMDDGVFSFDTTLSYKNFFESAQKKHVLFIQYAFPVLAERQITYSSQDFLILPNLLAQNVISFKTKNILLHLSFIDKELPYSKKEFLDPCLAELKKNGYIISPKNASEVLSVLIYKNMLFVGVLEKESLFSSCPLGRSRYLFEKEQICRAEFKILDSLDAFGCDLTTFKNAVDLGAAPGGWTRLLLKAGLSVVAVDPADMDPRLEKYSKFSHYRGLSQDFFKKNKVKYDLIVNDMRMSVLDTVKIMNDVAPFLSSIGFAIVTFKLNPNKKLKEANQGIEKLTEKYKIISARQLFHNRSEITVLLKSK